MGDFLTEDQFNERKSQLGAVLPWREVPTGVIYRIEDVEAIQTEKGEAIVVNLMDKEGEKLKAFATSILKKDLEGFSSDFSYFIKSLGLKNSTKNRGQSYYQYELVKEPSNDEGYDTVY